MLNSIMLSKQKNPQSLYLRDFDFNINYETNFIFI